MRPEDPNEMVRAIETARTHRYLLQSHRNCSSSGGNHSEREKVRWKMQGSLKHLLACVPIVPDHFRRPKERGCGGNDWRHVSSVSVSVADIASFDQLPFINSSLIHRRPLS